MTKDNNAAENQNKDKTAQDLDQDVAENIPAADMSGEVPDPIFNDDAPFRPSSDYMPDPIFEDDHPKPKQKRSLSQKELDELSASIPTDIDLGNHDDTQDVNPANHKAKPREHTANPFMSDTPHEEDDLASIPMDFEEDPEIEQRRKEIEKERSNAQSPDVFAAAPPKDKSKDADTISSPMDDSYEVHDAYSEEESDIQTDSLGKDEDSLLSEKDPTLRKIKVGCGWDMNAYDGDPIDLDLSCFLLNKNDMTRVDSDFIFYNNLKGADLAVIHSGDSLSGVGEGDDEAITIDLEALPYEIQKIVFYVTIYMGDEEGHTFGSVKNAFIRIMNAESRAVLARFDLNLDFAEGTALRFGELSREGNSWKFSADGKTQKGGLSKIAQAYGLLISGT